MGSSSSRPRPEHHQQPFVPPEQQFAYQQQQQQQPYGGYSNGQLYGGGGGAPFAHHQQQPYAPPQQHYTDPAGYQQQQHSPGGGFYQQPQQYSPYQQQPPPAQQQPPTPTPTHSYQQTQTIRNQVNLKKRTLKLVPREGAADGEFELSFAFDATAPCRVTTFVLATEDPREACRVVACTADARPPVYFGSGMNHTFPPDTAAAAAHAVSFAAHGGAELLSLARGDSYPLIVRLEALTDAALAEGRSLEQLDVGGALPAWAQAQTTYAKLRRDADEPGGWAVSVLKQKIWVQGTSYELQEIYGMDAGRLAGSGGATAGAAGSSGGGVATGVPDEALEGRECVICMSSERDTTVLPCRHMCMCQPCAAALKRQTNKCPICREAIESLLHIRIERQRPLTPAGAPSTGLPL